MEFKIRQEQKSDYQAVREVVELAFSKMEMSDHREHLLVDRLRKSEAFIPELSLVAESNGKIIGHILLTKVTIAADDRTTLSLGLAPVSVLPEYQGQGVGGTLIRKAHQTAAALGYGSVVLLGHKAYYPRFGYRKAIDFGIEFPFDVPHEHCMVIELLPDRLRGVHGIVNYSKPFME